MMKFYKSITAFLFLAALFTFSKTANAQKSFGREPETFMKELEAFMTKDRNESGKLVFEAFKTKWTAKNIPDDNLQRIIITCNEMLDKKLRPTPDFENFLNTIIAFVNEGKMESHHMKWDKLIRPYYNKKGRDLALFIETSLGLLQNSASSNTKTRTWYILSKDFDFVETNGRPTATFAKTDIKCVSPRDSGFLYETKGTFFMDDMSWEGKGGNVSWERAALDPKVCFAKLDKYAINFERGEYRADSVKFYNSEYLPGEVFGHLDEKIMDQVSSAEKASYPRFTSYRKDLIINKFVENVRYVGGYAQHGSKILASGDEKNPATFRYYYKNRLVLQVSGEELFVFKNEKVVTDDASVTLFLDSGTTIFHPRVNFNYQVADERVTITRGTEPLFRAPFIDNYHNMEIHADVITWNIKEPKIDIKMILKDEAATFYSYNFFKEYRYEKLQGMLAYNPLQKIKQYCDEKKVKEFYLKDYSKWAASTVDNLIPQFITLHDAGFLKYYGTTQFVQIYEKTFNYVNSHFGRTDYDVISFQSVIGGLPNASINLENFDMKIEGVPQVKFSDSQTVYVIPTEQRFTLRGNREMKLEGKVRAGRFEFFGKGFSFNYQKFTIDMNNVDSMRLFFPDENNNLVKVNSVLQDISGTLFIDQQYNKSGLKEYSEYPIFKSNKGSKVYYDYYTTFGGVYKRSNFYFSVDPFTIDSLDNFSRSGLRFPGTFTSADIFPEMRETLVLMDDYSLGFIKTATLPMYRGTGNTTMTMNLSNKGLFGTGEISFAGSVTKSDKFTLFPDSTNGFSESFDLKESTLNPGVKAKNVYTHWEPYKDRMSQFTIDEPMSLYTDAKFFGEYILGKKGSNANGNMHFNDAILGSRNMSLGQKKFNADTSTLVIKSIDTSKFAFRAVNVKADVNMEKRIGDFKALADGANSEFPYNEYKGSLNEFKWDIKAKTLRFLAPPGTPEEKQYFVSTNASQDSLNFMSKDALYDLKDFVLYANKVPYINIADARAIPDSGKVVIRQFGAMDTLHKAKLLVDTANKYHTLYDCKLYVAGKYQYYGDGYYDYIDRSGKKNKILFNDVRAEKLTKLTVARGTINIPHDFTLSPRIKYRGDVILTGANRGLDFDGFFMADTEIDPPLTWWVRHRQIVAPDSVFLQVVEPKNDDKKDLFTGFCVANDTALMYSNIFSRKRNYSDGEILNVNKGVFFYDDAAGEFIYADSQKLYANNPKGNYFSYNHKDGEMFGEGNVNFGVNTGELKMSTAGNVTHSLKDSSFEIKSILLLDFPFPEPALKRMYDQLVANGTGNISSNETEPFLEKALAEILDEKAFAKAKESIEKTGRVEPISELAKTLFFTDVDFTWSPKTKSFKAEGNFGLSNLGKDKLGKKMSVNIEIERKRSGDEITFYIESGSDDWYFFNYVRNKLYVLSTDNDFMNIIKENLEKYTKDTFSIGLATDQGRKKFLRSFETE